MLRRALTRIALPLLACAMGLGACYLTHPLFSFSNPNDPGVELRSAGSYGTGFMEGGTGISMVGSIAASPDGTFLAVVDWGQRGGLWIVRTADGSATRMDMEGRWPNSACVDSASRYVYATSDGSRIDRFDPISGSHSMVYSTANSGFAGITIASDDSLYVQGANQILRFQSDGTFLVAFNFLTNVRGMAAGNTLYVATDPSAILSLDRNTGAPLGEIYYDGSTYQNVPFAGAPIGGFLAPNSLAYNAAQQRLIVNFGDPLGVVTVLDPNNYTTPLIARIGVLSDFSNPGDARVTVDDAGHVYASDRWLNIITELTTGRVIYSQTPQPGNFLNCVDVTAGPDHRVYLMDRSLARASWFQPDDGSFHMFGTPGSAAGQLNWPTSIATDGTRIYCGTEWNGILVYDTDGNLVGQSPTLPGRVLRVAVLPNGQLLAFIDVWSSGKAFYTYDSSWTQSGPFLQAPPFSQGKDVSLCVKPDGTIWCGVWDGSSASIGTLAPDLSTYQEVWNSSMSGAEAFAAVPQDNTERFRISGIAPAPGTDVWVCFSALSAAVRFDSRGNIFASMSLWDERQGASWTPFQIVAYSIDQNGNWQGSNFGGICAFPGENVLWVFDNTALRLKRYTPAAELQ